MDATDFIQLGIKLLGRGTEAETRTAVSRLYYGAFHIASGILSEKCGIEIPENQAHAKLSQLFWRANNPNLENVGRQINSLRIMRRIADYELNDPKPSKVTWGQEPLLLTQDIIQSLTAWSSSADFQVSAENIRLYARDVLKLNVKNIE